MMLYLNSVYYMKFVNILRTYMSLIQDFGIHLTKCTIRLCRSYLLLIGEGNFYFLMLEIRLGIPLKYPEQPFLRAKQLFCLRNLLCNRKPEDSGNYFIFT